MGRRQGLRVRIGLGAIALLATAAALAAAASASPPPTPVTVTFTESGSHPFVVPAGVFSISVDAFGARQGLDGDGARWPLERLCGRFPFALFSADTAVRAEVPLYP